MLEERMKNYCVKSRAKTKNFNPKNFKQKMEN